MSALVSSATNISIDFDSAVQLLVNLTKKEKKKKIIVNSLFGKMITLIDFDSSNERALLSFTDGQSAKSISITNANQDLTSDTMIGASHYELTGLDTRQNNNDI